MHLFPNPAYKDTVLYLGFQILINGPAHIEIFNANGITFLELDPEMDSNEFRIPLKGIPRGLYYFIFTSKQGSAIQRLLII